MHAAVGNENDQPAVLPAPDAVERAAWLGWSSAGCLILLSAFGFWWGARTNGEFTYALDDPYIHLRLGQNLAENGVLGINPGEFASAGSSAIWPLLIASVTAIIGPRVGIPLVLSLICGAILLVLLDRWTRSRGLSLPTRVGLMASMIIVVPLLLMSFTGMEHMLQIGLSILLVHLAVEASFESSTRLSRLSALFGTALALSATRPEVLFVAAAVGLLLLMTRRISSAIAVGLGTLLPFVVVAAVNLGQGWPALPASVTAKGMAAQSGIARYLPRPEYMLSILRRPRLVAVIALLAIVLWLARRLGSEFDQTAKRWIWLALGITALHVSFSLTGWLFRYEAYLVALCLCALALGAESVFRSRELLDLSKGLRQVLAVGVIGLAAIGLADGIRINLAGITGMQEVSRQQREMARFSAKYCPGCRVAVNDIGMVSLYGDTTVTDVLGLANLQVLEAELDDTYGTDTWSEVTDAENTKWAMVYKNSSMPAAPEDWIKIGTWRWSDLRVVAGSEVYFYAIDPAVEEPLREAFADFPAPPGAIALEP